MLSFTILLYKHRVGSTYTPPIQSWDLRRDSGFDEGILIYYGKSSLELQYNDV